ncbi:hypothetical protein BD769DRAFT_1384541 [Suillus cothurnatus]|nr:hypothetical protein BD769DRAFT_1384541 [Suillus cothurnatus]
MAKRFARIFASASETDSECYPYHMNASYWMIQEEAFNLRLAGHKDVISTVPFLRPSLQLPACLPISATEAFMAYPCVKSSPTRFLATSKWIYRHSRSGLEGNYGRAAAAVNKRWGPACSGKWEISQRRPEAHLHTVSQSQMYEHMETMCGYRNCSPHGLVREHLKDYREPVTKVPVEITVAIPCEKFFSSRQVPHYCIIRISDGIMPLNQTPQLEPLRGKSAWTRRNAGKLT